MTGKRLASLSVCALAALALPPGALAQEIRLGNEFQVNAYTTGDQGTPWAAASAAGDFVVAWASNGQDGAISGIFARRFSSAGAALANEFQVNTQTLFYQGDPSLAASASGDFVVAWASNAQDGASFGVFARRFSSAGAALAGEFQVNTYTTNNQTRQSVAMDADGDFVVAWTSTGQDGDIEGIFARRFSSAGASLAGEFQVNTYTTNNQRYPSVAADADGDFVVAWRSGNQDGDGNGVFASRFSSAGVPLAGEFQVTTYTRYGQDYPSVAASASGDFVIGWVSFTQDGAGNGVFARRFSSAGAPLASEFKVNTYTTSNQYRPSVASSDSGDFVVVWTSAGEDGSAGGAFGRRFSSTGAPRASEFQVNTHTTSTQTYQSVAVDADGDFVVAWQSLDQDGSGKGVFAQRFAPPAPITLDIDDDGVAQPLTDGLLVLRFLFTFTGTTLTSGAVGGGCGRCDAATIQPYLGSLGLALDVDGNASVGTLTDGLLVLRYLFGFTGTTLTTGAVGGGCARCDSPSIEAYLAGLV